MSLGKDLLTAEVVDARLRALSDLSRHPEDAPSGQLEMTAEAITHRLIEVAEVSALCFALADLRVPLQT